MILQKIYDIFKNKRAKEKRRHAAEKAKNGGSGVSGSETLHVKPSTYEPPKYESAQSTSKMARYEASVPSPSFITMPPGGHYSIGQQSRNEFEPSFLRGPAVWVSTA